MADQNRRVGKYENSRKAMTGRQSYFLDVPGTANAKDLSVVSFEATERMGEPYRITIVLTHPDSLSRSDYLGKDAVFSIAPDEAVLRKFCGCITRFSKTKKTKDFSRYEIVVEAHLARLNMTRASRIYQHQTAPQIIEAILRRHGFEGHQFTFRLRRQYPQHAFRMQYQTADLAYVRMLMQKEGIYSYVTEGKHGDVVVFADDIDHYIYQPELTVPYRETAGLEAGVEAVFALQTHARAVPQSFAVADYNPDRAWERFRAEANVAGKDTTTYGQPYVYGTHHLDQDGAQWEAQLRHEAAIAWQIVHEGESNVLALQPARILRMDEDSLDVPQEVPHLQGNAPGAEDAPNGQVIIEVTHRGARDEAYRNAYKAIPSDRRFRLKLEEDQWPKIPGSLSARVTSPGHYKYAYLTQQGYYTVRFDLDFDEWNPGGESVPLRLAKPFAGALQTGFHFPALHGTEAVIEFRDGDPDKPYIAAFHHHSQAVDLVTSQDRWLSRNVMHTQGDNKLQFEDWENEEHVKLSTKHSGKSQLTLGHIVDGRRKKRGEGFELRTSAYGAIRGGKGLFISADDQPNAIGQQLDMEPAKGLLSDAMAQMQRLNECAAAARVQLADVERQRDLMEQRLLKLQQAVILLSAPAGIALATGESIQLAANGNVIATARSNLDLGAGNHVTIAAGQGASIFAQDQGIKLVAAKADFSAAAHSGQMLLASSKDMVLSSVDGKLNAVSAGALTLSSQGAYIKLDGGNIELGCPGSITLKTGNFNWQGPASMAPPLPALPAGVCRQCLLTAHTGVEAMTEKA
ncbi:type IV secretion protein Rhs [Paraburkholderia phytofirmans OLGA172]|uniref:Type IV secretion protein Rhs n=1 Tax=Paraburkholderia phytofirmans OLGA172 TaxID=1417228 RepID=A0A160FVM4_9BURK|nr:type VI secretion system tip protein VgrG [Paraburkholderia phytofirmans]ANB77395.1 type IV secretion protein Rhs [Paraburkholderia phytofirmans OLGA172]